MNELHLCIATGQNAANLIPLKQLKATEVCILETAYMKAIHRRRMPSTNWGKSCNKWVV